MDFFDSPYRSNTLDDSVGSFLENYIELEITCDEGATVVVNRYENNVIVDTINVGVVSSGECIVNLHCFGEWASSATLNGTTITDDPHLIVNEVRKYESNVSTGGGGGGGIDNPIISINKFVTNLVTLNNNQAIFSFLNTTTGAPQPYYYYVSYADNIITAYRSELSSNSNIYTTNLWPCSFKNSKYYYANGENIVIFYECMSENINNLNPIDYSMYIGNGDKPTSGVYWHDNNGNWHPAKWRDSTGTYRRLNFTPIFGDVDYNKYALYSVTGYNGSAEGTIRFSGAVNTVNLQSSDYTQHVQSYYKQSNYYSNLRRTVYVPYSSTKYKGLTVDFSFDFYYLSPPQPQGLLKVYERESLNQSVLRQNAEIRIQGSGIHYGDLNGYELVTNLKDGYLVYCNSKILLIMENRDVYEIDFNSTRSPYITCTLLSQQLPSSAFVSPGYNMIMGMDDNYLVIVSGLNSFKTISPGETALWGEAVFTSIDISDLTIVDQKHFYELFDYENGYFENTYAESQIEVQCCTYLGSEDSSKFIISLAGMIAGVPNSEFTEIRTISYENGQFSTSRE